MQKKGLQTKKKPGKTGLNKSLWKMGWGSGRGRKLFSRKAFFGYRHIRENP